MPSESFSKFSFQPFFVFGQQFIPKLDRFDVWIYVNKEPVIRDVHIIDYIALNRLQFGWFAVWRWITATPTKKKQLTIFSLESSGIWGTLPVPGKIHNELG